MQVVRQHLISKQEAFRSHPFFKELNKQEDFAAGMAFVPGLTFWVRVFQDILQMIPQHLKTPHLRRLANHHKHEDAGHNKWFLEDAAWLGNDNVYKCEWLFSPEHRLTREVTYRIVSEVFQGKDYQKVILILVLESTGHVFFENIADFVKRKGHENHLKYFSSYHLEIEKNHAVFEEKLEEELYAIMLSEEDRSQAIAMIDRTYDAFNSLFDHLVKSFASTPLK